ncbi:MAG: hypothetical protein AAGJ38_01430 [Planctomycetota bacterium]
MKIGVMDVVVGSSLDQGFAHAAELGCDGVEVNLQVERLHNDPAGFVEDVSALRDRHGLAVPSLVFGENNQGGLATWFREIGNEGWVIFETPGGESPAADLAVARNVYGGIA